jgi:uncharacterized protein YaiI (UPF0178 family)
MTVQIYIDADACPVKGEVYRVAERHALRVAVVANSPIAVPRDAWVRLIVVSGRPDAADDWIAEHATKGDIVITADVPLADRCIKAGASVIAPNGREFTDRSIGMAVATRDLMEQIRSAGGITGGPPAFSRQDRSAFLQTMERVIMRGKRAMGTR